MGATIVMVYYQMKKSSLMVVLLSHIPNSSGESTPPPKPPSPDTVVEVGVVDDVCEVVGDEVVDTDDAGVVVEVWDEVSVVDDDCEVVDDEGNEIGVGVVDDVCAKTCKEVGVCEVVVDEVYGMDDAGVVVEL